MQHPEHFARARAEVDDALAPAMAVGEPEQVERFPFLDAVCNESMRLKPVAPVNSLEPVEDVEILGHRIPRGTMVMALNRHIAMQDVNFGDGARFDPERWLAGAARGCPHDTDAFIPFGSGPRFCPGRSLALLQIRTVLAMFCRNFDVEPAFPARPVEEKHAFTMMPEKPARQAQPPRVVTGWYGSSPNGGNPAPADVCRRQGAENLRRHQRDHEGNDR